MGIKERAEQFVVDHLTFLDDAGNVVSKMDLGKKAAFPMPDESITRVRMRFKGGHEMEVSTNEFFQMVYDAVHKV
jgi:hypothetical protein